MIDWRDGDVVCTVRGVRVGVVRRVDVEADRMEVLCLVDGAPRVLTLELSVVSGKQVVPLRQLQREHLALLDALCEHGVEPTEKGWTVQFVLDGPCPLCHSEDDDDSYLSGTNLDDKNGYYLYTVNCNCGEVRTIRQIIVVEPKAP